MQLAKCNIVLMQSLNPDIFVLYCFYINYLYFPILTMYYQEAAAYTCQVIYHLWRSDKTSVHHTCAHIAHLHNHNWVTSCPVKIIPCYPAIYRSLLQTDQSLMLLPFAWMRMILLWFFGSLIILQRRSVAPWTRPRLNVWLDDASRQMWHPPWGN